MKVLGGLLLLAFVALSHSRDLFVERPEAVNDGGLPQGRLPPCRIFKSVVEGEGYDCKYIREMCPQDDEDCTEVMHRRRRSVHGNATDDIENSGSGMVSGSGIRNEDDDLSGSGSASGSGDDEEWTPPSPITTGSTVTSTRDPIIYCSNDNGTMVDMWCTRDNSKPSEDPASGSGDDDIATTSHPHVSQPTSQLEVSPGSTDASSVATKQPSPPNSPVSSEQGPTTPKSYVTVVPSKDKDINDKSDDEEQDGDGEDDNSQLVIVVGIAVAAFALAVLAGVIVTAVVIRYKQNKAAQSAEVDSQRSGSNSSATSQTPLQRKFYV